MKIKNTEKQFGLIAILFHWISALMIIGLLILGLYMVRLPISIEKLSLYGWHKELGILVLFIVIFRFSWRLINITPNLEDLPLWEKIIARFVHRLFYFFMFALPISGWLITSASALPVSFFGLFTLPNLIPANEIMRFLFSDIHEWLGYIIIALIILHTAAALKHHFINKDMILRRMIKP